MGLRKIRSLAGGGVLAALIWMGGNEGWGQSSKGILAGTVRDKSGAVIGHANLIISSQETGETRTVASSSVWFVPGRGDQSWRVPDSCGDGGVRRD